MKAFTRLKRFGAIVLSIYHTCNCGCKSVKIDLLGARAKSFKEMVDIVLRTNEQAKKHGCYVMSESSRVNLADHADHTNDLGTMGIAFDESVVVMLDHFVTVP